MSDFYSAVPEQKAGVKLPAPPSILDPDPSSYFAGRELSAAVNVAILTGQPLLVTGEPGTGKTELARSVAWQLGLGEHLAFETKSNSTARDLFYIYDALARFRDAQAKEGGADPRAYITYNALGLAILRANRMEDIADVAPPGFAHGAPVRSVVLIDEIDKAPRDFPNDLLNELAGMYFRIPELRNAEVRAAREMRPIVIITSNSEKNLPDAFLRRCVYYDIPFPTDRLHEIITRRIAELRDPAADGWIGQAIELFLMLRDEAIGLTKRPSTAELLAWIVALRRLGVPADEPLRAHGEHVRNTLGVLVKGSADLQVASNVATEWLRGQ
jgi:MoxR-like ATPase